MGTLLIYFVCEVFYTATSDTRAAVVALSLMTTRNQAMWSIGTWKRALVLSSQRRAVVTFFAMYPRSRTATVYAREIRCASTRNMTKK